MRAVPRVMEECHVVVTLHTLPGTLSAKQQAWDLRED